MFGLGPISGTPVAEVSNVSITGVSPETGPKVGQTAVVIYGKGFSSGDLVYFGNAVDGWVVATSIVVFDDGHIACVTPASPSYFIDDIRILKTNGKSNVRRFAFDRDSVGMTVAQLDPSTLEETGDWVDYPGSSGVPTAWPGRASGGANLSATNPLTQTYGIAAGSQNGHGTAIIDGSSGYLLTTLGANAITGNHAPELKESVGYTFASLLKINTAQAWNGSPGYSEATIIGATGAGVGLAISAAGSQGFQLDPTHIAGVSSGTVGGAYVGTTPAANIVTGIWSAIFSRWNGRRIDTKIYNGNAQPWQAADVFPDGQYPDWGAGMYIGVNYSLASFINSDLAGLFVGSKPWSTATLDSIVLWMQNRWAVTLVRGITVPAVLTWSALATTEQLNCTRSPNTMAWSAAPASEQLNCVRSPNTMAWSALATTAANAASATPSAEAWSALSVTIAEAANVAPGAEAWSALTLAVAEAANTSPAVDAWNTTAPATSFGGFALSTAPGIETWASLATAVSESANVAPGSEAWSAVTVAAADAASAAPSAETWSALSATIAENASVSPFTETWSTLALTAAEAANATPSVFAWSTLGVTGAKAAVIAPAANTWNALDVTIAEAAGASATSGTWGAVDAATISGANLAPTTEAWSLAPLSSANFASISTEQFSWAGVVAGKTAQVVAAPAALSWAGIAATESTGTSVTPTVSPWSSLAPYTQAQSPPLTPAATLWGTAAPVAQIVGGGALVVSTSPTTTTWTTLGVATAQNVHVDPYVQPFFAGGFSGGGGGGGASSGASAASAASSESAAAKFEKEEAKKKRVPGVSDEPETYVTTAPRPFVSSLPDDVGARATVTVLPRQGMRVMYENAAMLKVAGVKRREALYAKPGVFAKSALSLAALAALGFIIWKERDKKRRAA